MNPIMNAFAQHIARQIQAQQGQGQPQMSTPLQTMQTAFQPSSIMSRALPAAVQAVRNRGSKPVRQPPSSTPGRGMMLPPNQGGMQ